MCSQTLCFHLAANNSEFLLPVKLIPHSFAANLCPSSYFPIVGVGYDILLCFSFERSVRNLQGSSQRSSCGQDGGKVRARYGSFKQLVARLSLRL